MNVQEFISTTLSQIIHGVDDARHGLPDGTLIAPKTHVTHSRAVTKGTHDQQQTQDVNFDIAITVVESSEKEGSAGIRVASIGIGGSVGAGSSTEIINRVQFTVPVAFSPE